MTLRGALPAILTGISIVSAIGAVLFAINETPEAIKLLDDKRLELDETGETDISTKEKVKVYTKTYWPAAACLVVSAGTGIGSCVMLTHRVGRAMATAAGLSAFAAKNKDKIKELVGEEQAKLIDKEIKEEIKQEREYLKEDQEYWWMDSITGACWKMTYGEFYNAVDEAHKIINLYSEGVQLGEIFPQIKKHFPLMAKATWTKDYINTALDGYDWLDIKFKQINVPGSENDPIDWTKNDGRMTNEIHWGLWPLTPKLAADCGYLSPAE